MTAEQLCEAWEKYVRWFGEPPHGTLRQMAALLAFVPVEESVSFCNWCPNPESPSLEHHPNGQAEHMPHPTPALEK
jgi:hypothetical protein